MYLIYNVRIQNTPAWDLHLLHILQMFIPRNLKGVLKAMMTPVEKFIAKDFCFDQKAFSPPLQISGI